MVLETILCPAEIDRLSPEENRGAACVVFDILRATTSMVTALSNGAVAIYPVRTIPEALALRKKMPHALLGGERNGERIPGFDLGNSPSEYTSVAGREIITTTTNGTVALRACETAQLLLAASLLNLSATAEHLLAQKPSFIRIVCAGTFENFALEDALAAGLFLDCLLKAPGVEPNCCDASLALHALFEAHRDSWQSLLRSAKNARALVRAGRGADIEYALRVDSHPVVAVWREGALRAAAKPCNGSTSKS